jgi:hypothetical protein
MTRQPTRLARAHAVPRLKLRDDAALHGAIPALVIGARPTERGAAHLNDICPVDATGLLRHMTAMMRVTRTVGHPSSSKATAASLLPELVGFERFSDYGHVIEPDDPERGFILAKAASGTNSPFGSCAHVVSLRG